MDGSRWYIGKASSTTRYWLACPYMVEICRCAKASFRVSLTPWMLTPSCPARWRLMSSAARRPPSWASEETSRNRESRRSSATRLLAQSETCAESVQVSLWANNLVAELRRDSLFRDVSSEAQDGGLRAALDINRQRAGQLGVNIQGVNDTLN